MLISRVSKAGVIPNERIVEKSHGAGIDGTVTERLEPLDGNKTRLTILTETTLHAGPLAKFGESFLVKYMDHGIEIALEAAKVHIEARRGPPRHLAETLATCARSSEGQPFACAWRRANSLAAHAIFCASALPAGQSARASASTSRSTSAAVLYA